MRIIGQFAIILAIYLTGLLIERMLVIPIPGSIIGMILLLALLHLKIVKVENIKELSNFFLDNMMFFFIPATVSIMVSYNILEGVLIEVTALVIVSTLITISITALVVQFIAKAKDKRNG